MDHPQGTVRTVDEIRILAARGPWTTKSGGKLNVTFALPLQTLQDSYLQYENEELKRVPGDVRGLRVYTVRDLPLGSIGGTEWHRIREEMIFVLEGSVRWMCEDLLGGTKDFALDPSVGVWMPPFIRHTYEVLESGSGLFVVANTLFVPEDPATHDTYSPEEFKKLQEVYMKTGSVR